MAVLVRALRSEVHIGVGGNSERKLGGKEDEEAAVGGKEAVLYFRSVS